MQVFKTLQQIQQNFVSCVATVGKYDGLHVGHQLILDVLLEEANMLGLPSVVVLSEPQPEEFFGGSDAPPRLNHFYDKVEFLTQYGVDAIYCLNFDHDLSQQSAEYFVREFLVNGLRIKSMVVGDDFRFGKNRKGDYVLLQKLAQELHFKITAVAPCCYHDERVSSTLIRANLQAGDCKKVQELLGRNYSISGRIIKGRQLGRQIGVPTANLELLTRALPIAGVFAVSVKLRDMVYQGVANAGFKPTVSNQEIPSLEVHLLNFNEEIYGESIQVQFEMKIRDEKKFTGLEQLQQQIKLDIDQVKKYFNKIDQMIER